MSARDAIVDAAADAVLDAVGDFLAQGNPFQGQDGETMLDLVQPVNRAFTAYLESLVGSEARAAALSGGLSDTQSPADATEPAPYVDGPLERLKAHFKADGYGWSSALDEANHVLDILQAAGLTVAASYTEQSQP